MSGVRRRVPEGVVLVPDSYFEPLDIGSLWGGRLFEVELGAGDGSFLVDHAALHPEVGFLGIERLLGRLRKAARRVGRRGLSNVRLLRIEAAYCLRYLLPEASVSAVHVYFPDPWPKKRHRKNRLVNPEFVPAVRRVLCPGGVVYLRTDDEDYWEQMGEVFAGGAGFEPVATPEGLAAVRTDFEREFNARGVATRYRAYRRAG